MSFRGVLLNKTADQTAVNLTAGANLSFDAEVYDTDAFHTGGAPTQITIPSAVNNEYGILTAFAHFTSFSPTLGSYLFFQKGGAPVALVTALVGKNGTGNGQSSTAAWMQLSSPPLLLATGDFYEVFGYSDIDNSITIESETSFGLAVLDDFAAGYCLAKMGSDFGPSDFSTPTALAWDGTDVYDTHGVHSPSSNNTKLIIPASLNGKYVYVRATVLTTSVTTGSNAALAIRKGGSLVYSGVGANSSIGRTATEHGLTAQTQAIQVSTGDEFEALYYNADTSTTVVAARSSFGLWVIG